MRGIRARLITLMLVLALVAGTLPAFGMAGCTAGTCKAECPMHVKQTSDCCNDVVEMPADCECFTSNDAPPALLPPIVIAPAITVIALPPEQVVAPAAELIPEVQPLVVHCHGPPGSAPIEIDRGRAPPVV